MVIDSRVEPRLSDSEAGKTRRSGWTDSGVNFGRAALPILIHQEQSSALQASRQPVSRVCCVCVRTLCTHVLLQDSAEHTQVRPNYELGDSNNRLTDLENRPQELSFWNIELTTIITIATLPTMFPLVDVSP